MGGWRCREEWRNTNEATKPIPMPNATDPEADPRNSPTSLKIEGAVNSNSAPFKRVSVWNNTTLTLSFNMLSPNTMEYNILSAPIAPKIDSVATGSTLAIKVANVRDSMIVYVPNESGKARDK
jgi:hypothetical protein